MLSYENMWNYSSIMWIPRDINRHVDIYTDICVYAGYIEKYIEDYIKKSNTKYNKNNFFELRSFKFLFLCI